jgi:hypothetical protein
MNIYVEGHGWGTYTLHFNGKTRVVSVRKGILTTRKTFLLSAGDPPLMHDGQRVVGVGAVYSAPNEMWAVTKVNYK